MFREGSCFRTVFFVGVVSLGSVFGSVVVSFFLWVVLGDRLIGSWRVFREKILFFGCGYID